MRHPIMGDKVEFHFPNMGPITGTLLYAPSSPGDSWVIRNGEGENSEIVYVQTFAFMVVVPREVRA